MPLDIPIVPLSGGNLASAAHAAPIREPMDLNPAIERMMQGFREGFINSQDIAKRKIVGTTDATKARNENIAAAQKAHGEQDTIPDSEAFKRLDSLQQRGVVGGVPVNQCPPGYKQVSTPEGTKCVGSEPAGTPAAFQGGSEDSSPSTGNDMVVNPIVPNLV